MKPTKTEGLLVQILDNGNKLVMRTPDNWHAHFRHTDPVIQFVVESMIKYGFRGRVVAMPNLPTPILTGADAVSYVGRINAFACGALEAVPTIQIVENTPAATIRAAYECGVRMGKVYPRYVTTNSENGVVEYDLIRQALAEAERICIAHPERPFVVQFHAEHPSYDVIGRLKEEAFIDIIAKIHRELPGLKISIEHISSRAMVEWVWYQDNNVGAGITIQHILFTSDDLTGYSKLSGGKIKVSRGYKPLAKDPDDRAAVQAAALSGSPKFWYADDSAIHGKKAKFSDDCPCGGWNTMEGLSELAEWFHSHGKLPLMSPFLSEHGARFYGCPLNKGTITMVRRPWLIPMEVEIPGFNDSCLPILGGEITQWAVLE